MPFSKEGEEYYSTGPNIYTAALIRIIKQGFKWNIPSGPKSISNSLVQLYAHYFLCVNVVGKFCRFALSIDLDICQAKINKQASVGVSVVEEVGRLDIAVDDSFVKQKFHSFNQSVHISSDIINLKTGQVVHECLSFLVFCYQSYLSFESICADQTSHIIIFISEKF